MRKVPEKFKAFNKLYPRVADAYENLASECHNSGPLSEKERILAKLGIAIGSGLEGSVRSQVRKAFDAGMNREEVEHAFLLSITAIGFPAMMAALMWAEDILNEESAPRR
jgi:alkylhydroperoxidase/carboxymuconolactone decarboxylase family protein YurZ